MTKQTLLYIVRHGQTYFNKSNRVQGWSDTPLTPEGAKNIAYLGKGLKDIPFELAYSSDAGRARETTQLILAQQAKQKTEHLIEPAIREWSFGSYEGQSESQWIADLAASANYQSPEVMMKQPLSYQEIATHIHQLDSEGWSEPYPAIEQRIMTGFTTIAERLSKLNGGNGLVVSHGLTIAHFLSLISPEPLFPSLENGSVSKVLYQKGHFSILETNSLTYMGNGKNAQ